MNQEARCNFSNKTVHQGIARATKKTMEHKRNTKTETFSNKRFCKLLKQTLGNQIKPINILKQII